MARLRVAPLPLSIVTRPPGFRALLPPRTSSICGHARRTKRKMENHSLKDGGSQRGRFEIKNKIISTLHFTLDRSSAVLWAVA